MDNLIIIPKEDVLSSFIFEGQEYCLLSNNEESEDEISVSYCKIDHLDGNNFVLRDIDSDAAAPHVI